LVGEECVGGGVGLSSNGAKFGVPYYKQFLDKRCGMQKDCCLCEYCILEKVGVICALLVLFIVVFEITGFWWGSLREGDHWGDPGVDGRIILR
jgi:hypothetical protein